MTIAAVIGVADWSKTVQQVRGRARVGMQKIRKNKPPSRYGGNSTAPSRRQEIDQKFAATGEFLTQIERMMMVEREAVLAGMSSTDQVNYLKTPGTPSSASVFLRIVGDAVISIRDHQHSFPDDLLLQLVRASPALFGEPVPLGTSKRSGHFASPPLT